ncbi:variable surface protein [Plasmodium gonderi]|uniref:Variable surface protein n=1 Tax=Plasmodium gonderi TaxID=77519 RepID=A0A1Y1JHP0_PLAGO|nr:variable surface protein [Plasmodium gonderi]GAW82041.1 variable surface protein [Plasmodium gonderi]
MAAKVNNYTLNMFAEEDETLKDYVLYSLYNYTFDMSCKDEDEAEFTCPLQQYYDFKDKEIEQFYKKFIDNLHKISKKNQYFNGLNDNDDKLCTYLKYWFYEYILNKGYEASQINKIYDAWYNSNNTFIGVSPCNIHRLNLNQIQEIKRIYDYFMLYDRNDKEKISSDKILQTKYCQYFENAHIMYLAKEVQCERNTVSPICKEFNEYLKKYITYNDELSFSCEVEEKNDDYFYHSDLATWKPKVEEYFDELQIDTSHEKPHFSIISEFGKRAKYAPLKHNLYPKIQRIKGIFINKFSEAISGLTYLYESQDLNKYDSKLNILYNSY